MTIDHVPQENPQVICFGAAHWDVIARVRQGAQGRDTPGVVERRPGGVALNVARALAAAGCHAGLVAPLGDDEEGQSLSAALAAEGVETKGFCVRSREATGCYVAIERADGELLAAVAHTAALDALAPAELPLDRLPPAAAWFLDANLPEAVVAVLAARRQRPPLFADAVSEAKAPKLRPILAWLQGLYCNRVEAEAICGTGLDSAQAAAQALLALGVERAVVTDGPAAAADAGPQGLAAQEPDDGVVRSVTGAGDALLAAHLAATLSGRDAATALAAGLAAARNHTGRRSA